MSTNSMNMPTDLQEEFSLQWQGLEEAFAQHNLTTMLEQGAADLQRVALSSPWCVEQWKKIPQLLQPDWYVQPLTKADMAADLQACLEAVTDEVALARVMRQFRQRHQVRLIWRHTLQLGPSYELTQEISNFADVCIDGALQWLYADCVAKWGEPQDPQGNVQKMVVLGMGKLGGGELNLSSDIDLIFAFPAAGETHGARKCLDNQQFFIRLGQRLIQALDTHTGDGFVFRVDMRLRPYGASGAMALNFTAMELYYQGQGREWERYAFIKARVVAGDQQAGQALLASLRPFVYRRYLDYSAIESLRSLKQMIASEVRRRGLHTNIKLGSGGIREVEFIAQAFQLIRGGRDQRLQTTSLMTVLDLLPDVAGWQQQEIDELKQAYWFLRDVEHAIQGVQDKQTQTLPDTPIEQSRLAFAMGFEDWQALEQAIDAKRQFIHSQFAQVIAHEDDEVEAQEETGISTLCSELALLISAQEDDIPEAQWLAMLEEAGFAEPEQVLKHLFSLYQSRAARSMQGVAQERLAKLLPALMQLCSKQQDAAQTLARVLVLIEAVLRRSVYLVLLQENPSTLKLVVDLCAASPWFGDYLARQPSLLDELLDVHSLFEVPTPLAMQQDLQQRLLRVPEEDTEQLMGSLRHFKHASALRIAAQEVTGKLPLMKVSDQLTFTAEAILQQVLRLAWYELSQRHGEPCDADGPNDDFIIVGYGKVGGWELSYGSDLDLVFIYDAPSNGMTNGEKSIANSMFYTRLGQRIISYLNTVTAAGQLYEVDMRLRPDGAKGLLVSTIEAFGKYQREQAWTWEHQALVRARPVAGSERLTAKFKQVREAILSQQREQKSLRQDVTDMREKMRDNLASKPNKDGEYEHFHLKQDQGGIVDIEFMVQYAVLAYAHLYPSLLVYSDNIRILDAMEAEGIMPQAATEALRDCYRTIRAVEHRQALQNQSGKVAIEELQEQRAQVQAIWQEFMLA